MKRILLTSTAMVAFAGAAAADISFSGTAEFSYNTESMFAQSVEITAAGSQALNNGYTASASLTMDDTGAIAAGDITVSSDAASISYHITPDGNGAAHVGDNLSQMSSGETAVFGDGTATDAKISGSATMGGATIRASLDDGGVYELGVSTDLGGTALNVGMTQAGAFGLVMSGSASSVDYSLGFASDNAYALNASTTAGGADLGLNFGSDGWDLSDSMPLGVATVGLTFDDNSDWTVSINTSMDALAFGLEIDQDSAWTATAGYAAGDVTVDFETTSTNTWSLDATYDLGNGVTAGVGTTNASSNYAEVNYDLGGGAALALEYGTADMIVDAEGGPDEDILAGTTISVSFSF